ncbi:MAG: hypothetical protein K5798_08510 [Nitrosopumilus sp.]|uniref:Uncharacterized protein n=1 Tax=Nitrosopumilus zosterae TaxID=718286 RepID=A0A2S2KPU3_9ARCH|nr:MULTISPECIES: hypothetical protein [Nitrosopumilus]MCV0367284.1 hypothetical protein [Nitrosopumilus sp.]BDQ31481.1 hypothetical protein NZOSNM25_001601 [Nitrosopumilus zosterae]GBH33686.1 hypothetical protein NZNM25_04770 [Nitrosopumilus zosterae]
MADCVQTWRRQLRIQELANIARDKLESGTEITQVYEILDEIMVSKWRSIPTTRKQYLNSVKKVLENQNM